MPGAPPDPAVMAALQQRFTNELMKDIMPFVEKNYSALTMRDNRAIAGLLMGGGHTWINWRRNLNELAPRLFRTAGE